MTDQSIGMMEGAFFVPKGDLLNWVNNLLELNIVKIQQLGTGAVYCQILDVMFPGKIKINKINWKARNEWEFIQNFKILQQGFQKCNIKKHIQIQKLSKSKYQDNLQFMQWFKRFYDLNGGNKIQNYDPKLRRGQEVNFSFVDYRQNPKKRQNEQKIRRGKSKSPLGKIQNKLIKQRKRQFSLNNKHTKSITKEQGVLYLSKLRQIEKVLSKSNEQNEKLLKIQDILKEIHEEIEEDLPVSERKETQIQQKLDLSLKEQNSVPFQEMAGNKVKKLKTQIQK